MTSSVVVNYKDDDERSKYMSQDDDKTYSNTKGLSAMGKGGGGVLSV